MNTALDILASGSDNGSDKVRVGGINEDGSLNVETQEWLNSHCQSAMMEIDGEGDRNQTFPVLLVYKPEAFTKSIDARWKELGGKADERLAALYVTDKVVFS